jgi:tRNA-modifying protein YgfZ
VPVVPDVPTTELAWSEVLVTGPEARTYLQGQLTQDVLDLSERRWSLLLDPDSTVVAPVLVEPRGEALALVLEAGLLDGARSRLARFRLRVRCELGVTDAVAGPFATLGERVAARWPGAPEMGRGLTPHGLGRDVLEATVSFTKGCFTGQELVGRLDARGAPVPWRLVAATGPSVGAIEAALASSGPPGPRGVTTAVTHGEAVAALGVAHRTLKAGRYGDVRVDVVGEPAVPE